MGLAACSLWWAVSAHQITLITSVCFKKIKSIIIPGQINARLFRLLRCRLSLWQHSSNAQRQYPINRKVWIWSKGKRSPPRFTFKLMMIRWFPSTVTPNIWGWKEQRKSRQIRIDDGYKWREEVQCNVLITNHMNQSITISNHINSTAPRVATTAAVISWLVG